MDDSSTIPQGPNPSGLCMCGCGQRTSIAEHTRPTRGQVKGQPLRYVKGHNRLTSPVDYIVDLVSGCWVWQHCRSHDGYGQTRDNGKKRAAHAVLWERANGRPVPAGLQLDHLCRNRACVNPDHLEVVTSAENSRRGSNAKLTIESAREIKSLLADGASHSTLASQYGVSCGCIGSISTGRTWKDVGK